MSCLSLLVVVDTMEAEMYLDSSVPSEQMLYLFYCLKEMASCFTFILQDFLRLALGKPFGIAEMFRTQTFQMICCDILEK